MTASIKWRDNYLGLAKYFSTWSKDPSRKIGAVAVGNHGQILAQGYNGFPRGIEDSEERLNVREVKYKYVVHAEMNMIFNACMTGVSLVGSDVYVYGLPVCSECAKGIIQAGVKSVTCLVEEVVPETWLESWERTQSMFNEVGIKCEIVYASDCCGK